MHGREKALLDAEPLVENLCDRGETVGRAACVGDDVMLCRIVHLVVHAENDRDILVLGRGADNDLLDSALTVGDRLGRVSEQSGALQNQVHAKRVPRNLSRILAGKALDGLAINGDGLLVMTDGPVEGTIGGIVFEKMRVGGGCGQIVYRDDFEVIGVPL